jgi:hypothetical protein
MNNDIKSNKNKEIYDNDVRSEKSPNIVASTNATDQDLAAGSKLTNDQLLD